MPTNLESLRNLCEKVTGKVSKATNTAEAINEIAEGYTGGGGGVGAVTGTVTIDNNADITNSTCTSEVEVKEVENAN